MIKERKGSLIWRILKLLAAFTFFALAVREQTAFRQSADIVTVFLDANSLNAKRAEEICNQEAEREEAPLICFWKEQSDVRVFCQKTGQSCSIIQILIKGNPELLRAEAAFLIWNSEGCFIDSKTAAELFGTEKAAGQIIQCEDKRYIVLGCVESEERIMISQALQQENESFTAVSLRMSHRGNVRGQTEQFILRNGLSGKMVDFVFLESLVSNLLLLFPCMIIIKMIKMVLKDQKKNEMAVTGAALILMVWLIVEKLAVPVDMVPSRWSDFAFWGERFESEKTNLFRILKISMGGFQRDMIFQMGKSAVSSIAAVFLLL